MCFNNLIGIKSDKDATTTPRSGLYFEDLEGINLSTAAAIADENHLTGVNLFQNKLDLAYKLVSEDIKNILHPNFRYNSVIDNKEIGKFTDDYLPVTALERGVKIVRTNSRLTRIYIRKVTILLNTTVSDNIKVTDGNTVTLFPFSATAGEELEVAIDYKAKNKEVFITIDNAAIEVNSSDLYDSSCGCKRNDYDYFYIKGWDGSFTQSKTYGIKPEINLECDDEDLACMVIHKLDFISWYRAGIELLKELIVSDRLNYYTIFDQDKAEEKLEEWKNEYNQRLNNLIPTISTVLNNVDDICIQCTKNRIKTQMP